MAADPRSSRRSPLASVRGGRGPRFDALAILVLSRSVQGFFLSKVPAAWVEPNTRWELPAIAVSLATTGRFADAYALPTGATAHLPPVPPAIYAVIYWLFGLGHKAGYVAWFSDLATYSLLWASLPWVATRVGLPRPAGVLAGLAGALVPRWPGHGEALAALSMAVLMAAFAGRWSAGTTPGRSLLLGVAAGAAFHVQPALLPVVLGWLAFEAWWGPQPRSWLHATLVIGGIVLACLPWTLRNHRAFDAWFFIRSNFGLELRMGNHEGAEATMDAMDRAPEQRHVHPRAMEEEARKVQQLGEAVYMRRAGREAMHWIAANPTRFAELTATRVVHWWLGPLDDPPTGFLVSLLTLLALVGAWRVGPVLTVPARAALLVPALTYPLVYYVMAYMPRYREPMDWLLLLAAGAGVWSWIGAASDRGRAGDARVEDAPRGCPPEGDGLRPGINATEPLVLPRFSHRLRAVVVSGRGRLA